MIGHYVGLMVEDTCSLLEGLLGILKSGNCIVPINPQLPDERVCFIVNDSSIRVLLTDRTNYAKARQITQLCLCLEHLICIDDVGFTRNEKKECLPAKINEKDMDHSCYVIYTSGSTGKPKGVQITNYNLVPLLLWFHAYFTLGAHNRVLQNLSYTFDFGIFELLTTLLAGGTLYFFNKKTVTNLNEYGDFIHLHQINTLHTTPSFFAHIIAPGVKLSPLKLLHFGGEQLNGKMVAEASEVVGENCYIYNGYGPTETTINSSIFSIKVNGKEPLDIPHHIPIGKPSANNIIFILDTHGRLQPVGITGELHIGGSGVARGYLNQVYLSFQRFKDNPFLPGDRLYRTGDLGRWLPDGNIEFLGRVDHQVKIRGFRIELGEIESQLKKHLQIKEAVVLAKEDKEGEKYLCAYIVSDSDTGFEILELREYLAGDLPDYMIPSYFVQLEKIPLNSNGKIDRKALPEPDPEAIERYTAPRNEVEEKLAEIWSEVLGIEKKNIGINSNFFEMGGHSIKASILLSKLHKELNTKIPMEALFKTPTIKKLSQYIRFSPQQKYKQIELAEKKEYYPLSSGQKRLFTLYQMEGREKNQSYNMPGLFSLEGKLDKKRFEDTFHKLIERHETLRTSFHWVNGDPVQKINDNPGFSVSFNKLNENAVKERIKEFIRPFDLGKAPLIRVQLIQVEEEKYYIFCDMHHIISDGMSMNILQKEFFYFYKRKELISLRIQYKDYSIWQNRLLDEDNSEKLESYWLKKMANFTFTELPADKFNSTKSLIGEKETIIIDNPLNKRIAEFCSKTGVTKFIFLISIFLLVLSQEIDQKDITIGIPIINRENDLENLIGFFLNVILVRLIVTENNTFLNNLSRTKEIVLEALDNSSYPFELLAAKLEECSGANSNELFTILFNYFPIERKEELVSDEFKIRPLHSQEVLPKYNITLYVADSEDVINLNLVYKSDIYNEFRIKRILENILNITTTVLENENIKISDIEILDHQDYDELEARFEYHFEDNDLILGGNDEL